MKHIFKELTVFATVVTIAVMISACGNSNEDKMIVEPKPSELRLVPFKSDAELSNFSGKSLSVEDETSEMIKEMESNLDKATEGCRTKEGYVYGNDGVTICTTSPVEDIAMADAAATDTSSDGSAVNYTTTNVQEAGVDEADIIKTNGEYTYALGGKKLHIIKTWPKESFGELGSIDVEGDPISLYLIGEMGIVLSTVHNGSEVNTKVTFISMNDPKSPRIARESYYDGRFVSSRMIEKKVYVITQAYFKSSKPAFDYYIDPQIYPECDDDKKPVAPSQEMLDAVTNLKEKNKKIAEEWKLSRRLPIARHKIDNAPIDMIVPEYSDFSRAEAVNGTAVIGIIKIDATLLQSPDRQLFIVGRPSTIYASTGSIFIASPENNNKRTALHRFELDGEREDISYFGSSDVEGHLLNQFSMSEYDGYLRVAATNSTGLQTETSVSVFDATDPDMPLLGHVNGIGKNEAVYAVRFIGKRGFVVTFKQIDPLFVIDLQNPNDPKIAGELVVPGFSTYLHPLDDDHLIGIGRDGANLLTSGLKLSLFDVTDSANPKEDNSIIIGKGGTDSPALADHHAFTFDKENGLLALPLTYCNGSKSKKNNDSYNGAQVYNVGVDSGFGLVDEVKDSMELGVCNYWGYSGKVLRTVLIGGDSTAEIILIKDDGLSAYELGGEKVGDVGWEATLGIGTDDNIL